MSAVDPYKLDFSNMLCNVMALAPKQNPLEEFDFLKKHKEFHVPTLQLNKIKTLKYLCLVYDRGSPLHDAYKDLWRRKMIAAELAQFVKEPGGRYKEVVEDMMKCNNKVVNAMIMRYLTGMYSGIYQRYALMCEMHARTSEKMLAGEAKIDDFNKVCDALEKAEHDLLSGDNLLIPDLTRYYFEDKLELRPEDIALRLSNGDEPVIIEEAANEDGY